MKAIKKYLGGFFVCLMEIIIGILLLIDPVGFTDGIITVCGLALLTGGLILIVKYFVMDPVKAAASQYLLKGLFMALLGGFCVLMSEWVISTFPLMALVYGVVILIFSLTKVQEAVDQLRMKNKKWYITGISALISLVCAVVILSRPFATTALLWTFTGISLIAEAVLDMVTLFLWEIKVHPDSVEEN